MRRPPEVPPHRHNLRVGRHSEPGQPYHITKCLSIPGLPSLAVESRAALVIDSIRWHQTNGHAHLLAFVVMPEHVHWLFVLGEHRSLAEVLCGFAKNTATALNKQLGRAGPLWEEGYYEHAVRRTTEAALGVLAYIHANPVRRDLCTVPEAWPWSTANARYEGWIERDWLW